MTRLTRWAALHPEILYLALLVYLGAIFYLPGRVQRKHQIMPYWYRLHGLLSLFLLILLVPETLRIVINGWSWAVCDRASLFTAQLSGWAINLYFFSKFLDLAETLLIVLDDRRPLAIHVLHHTTTFYFFWISTAGEVALLRPFIIANLASHMLLYSYLTPLKFCGIRPCYISVALSQMMQFAICLLGCIRAHVLISAGRQCHINHSWLHVTTTGVLCFFFLFADFYHQRYTKFRRERMCSGQHSSHEGLERKVRELRSYERVNRRPLLSNSPPKTD